MFIYDNNLNEIGQLQFIRNLNQSSYEEIIQNTKVTTGKSENNGNA